MAPPSSVPPLSPLSSPTPASPISPETPYYLAFERVKGIGPVKMRLLKEHFGTLARAWQADYFSLSQMGLDERVLSNLSIARKTVVPEQEWERVCKAGVTVITFDDATYPRMLRQVHDPPPVLYVRGALTMADDWSIGIVGTRQATVYGREVAEMLGRELALHGLTVVSGMARGVDAYAHLAAIAAGGRTLAVLGCGVDVVYPAEHRKLAQQIMEHGALVSDYPLGTRPDAMNFPPRNRIISGLSLGVVVVEADEKSGALITTQFAADQGREVFAVPGNILNRTSRGTNKLIQQGAKMVLDIDSILEELNLTREHVAAHIEVQKAIPENDLERKLVKHLSHEPTQTDALVRELQLPTDVVTATLALMELKGLVRQATGNSYILVRESKAAYKA